jgi:hypothetical protein
MELGKTALFGGPVQEQMEKDTSTGATRGNEVQTLFLVTPELVDESPSAATVRVPGQEETK